MNKVLARLASITALGVIASVLSAGGALADPKDYRFEAVQPHVQAAADSVVAVRLVHVPDNKPVKDAVVFSPRMEMPMAGMAPMVTPVSSLKPTAPGEYPFKSDLSTGGSWTLTLSAKVQGETGTVTGSVPFMAMK